MMTLLGELRLPAKLENIRTVVSFVSSISQHLKLTEKVQFEIELAVEEAVSNIVQHAYTPDEPGDMLIAAALHDDTLHLTLIDWGKPMQPGEITPFDINAPVETRITGGMGLHFINTLMDHVTRHISSTPDEPNILKMEKSIVRLQPGEKTANPVRDLNAMLKVSRVVGTTTDLDRLLALILDELVTTLNAQRGTLYLIDEERGELVSHKISSQSHEPRTMRARVGDGIAGTVASTGQVLNIQDAAFDPRYDSSVDAKTGYLTQTVLAAPMRNPQGEIIGVVQVLNKQGDSPFTVRDEQLLTAMSAQAAISIENARLYAQEIQQQLVNQELETARGIQQSFMPQESPHLAGWDISMLWTPMHDVAGDFYDFFHLPDGRLALLIADVSGKGIPAAMFMALSQTVLRFAMSLNNSPIEVMERTNRFILDHQRSRMFATVFAGYLDPASGRMAYASAGHNPPMHYHAATEEITELYTPGVALGVFRDAKFEERVCKIEPGDIVLLYTDGITEAINNAATEFGEHRLAALLRQNVRHNAYHITQAIKHAVADFAGGGGIFDDETLMILKRL